MRGAWGPRLATVALALAPVAFLAAFFLLPLSGMLGALLLMERARRRLSRSRFPGILFDPIVDAFAWLAGHLRRRPVTGGRR